MGKPEIVSKEAFTVVGLKYRGKNENQEIPSLWRMLLPRFGEIKGMVKSEVSYGVMGNMDHDSGEFDYLAGYEFVSEDNIPEGMETWSIPEQKYAVFPATLPTLMDVFANINDLWFPESDLKRSDGIEFELYDESFDPQDASSLLFLYIPIV
jgi:AraC family transcriptional regulator